MPKAKKSIASSSRGVDATFGVRLRDAMSWKGVAVGTFATQVKVHPVTVSKWRKGHRPAPSLMARVAELLGVSFNWLNADDGPMVEGEVSVGESTPPIGAHGVTVAMGLISAAEDYLRLAKQALTGEIAAVVEAVDRRVQGKAKPGGRKRA